MYKEIRWWKCRSKWNGVYRRRGESFQSGIPNKPGIDRGEFWGNIAQYFPYFMQQSTRSRDREQKVQMWEAQTPVAPLFRSWKIILFSSSYICALKSTIHLGMLALLKHKGLQPLCRARLSLYLLHSSEMGCACHASGREKPPCR